MFVTRILLDSFSDLDKMLLIEDYFDMGGENPQQNCLVSVRIGDVEQNGLLHKNSALEVTLNFNYQSTQTKSTVYKSVFKGHNMAELAVEWIAKVVEGYFGPVNKAAILNRLKPQIVQELSVISNK